MKKALTILLALSAIACTKSEVAYNDSNIGEISFMPVSGNITKAAITDGLFRKDNHIGLFAYYTPNVSADADGTDLAIADYDKFTKTFFYDTEFYCKDNTKNVWAGLASQYWPVTGSVVFAGYSLEPNGKANNVAFDRNGTAEYTLGTDCLTISNYQQSNLTDKTYDLLYFGRTDKSYGRNTTIVPLVFHHALAWIEIQIKGDTGSLVSGREWAISKVEFEEINTKGTFKYTGTAGTAEWSAQTNEQKVVVFNTDNSINPARLPQVLTDSFEVIENVENGTLLIPQDAQKLYVTVEYQSAADDHIVEIVEVDIPAVTPIWEAGKKYPENGDSQPSVPALARVHRGIRGDGRSPSCFA
jgi:hypothetical protein